MQILDIIDAHDCEEGIVLVLEDINADILYKVQDAIQTLKEDVPDWQYYDLELVAREAIEKSGVKIYDAGYTELIH